MKNAEFFFVRPLLASFGLTISIIMPVVAEVTIRTNPENGLIGWTLSAGGMQLELIQRLPDQTRGFLLARKFPAGIADQIATGCIFQTILRNTGPVDEPLAISVSLTDWHVSYGGAIHAISLKEDLDAAWPDEVVPASSRLAFRWAMFPTKQTFSAYGDYNWGMTRFGPAPGEQFDLHVFWKQDEQAHDAWIKSIECAPDR